MTWLLLSLLIYIFLISCGLLVSVLSIRTRSQVTYPYLKISVVIAAKNEGKNISGLISSLKNLEYPKDLFEIIIVDDNSTDNILKLLTKNISPDENIKYFSLPKDSGTGKKNALTFGINKSSFDYILVTDADCIPSSCWVKSFAHQFSKGYDLLLGISPYLQAKSFLNKITCFENLRAHILTFGAANAGFAYSGAARSMGFKKESFLNLGGYSKTLELKSGDDDLLIREAVKNNLKIGVVADKTAFVFTNTKPDLKSYFYQKSRHASTSNHYLFKHILFLSVWHLANLALILSPFVLLFSPISMIAFASKIVLDITLILILQKKFGYKFNFPEIIFLQIIYELFLIVHYIGSFAGRNRPWK